MSNNEITLSTIYNFMVDKFEQIDRRFEQIDQKFEQIDRRFEQIEKRLDLIEKRLDGIDTRITLNTNAILKMEQNFNDKFGILYNAEKDDHERISMLSFQTTQLFENQENLKAKIETLEKKAI